MNFGRSVAICLYFKRKHLSVNAYPHLVIDSYAVMLDDVIRAWQINRINRINNTNRINNGSIDLCKLGLGSIGINWINTDQYRINTD